MVVVVKIWRADRSVVLSLLQKPPLKDLSLSLFLAFSTFPLSLNSPFHPKSSEMELELQDPSATLELDEDEAREEDMAGADSRLAQLRLLRLRQLKRRQLLLRKQQLLQGAP